jgi:hypothetical protein
MSGARQLFSFGCFSIQPPSRAAAFCRALRAALFPLFRIILYLMFRRRSKILLRYL